MPVFPVILELKTKCWFLHKVSVSLNPKIVHNWFNVQSWVGWVLHTKQSEDQLSSIYNPPLCSTNSFLSTILSTPKLCRINLPPCGCPLLIRSDHWEGIFPPQFKHIKVSVFWYRSEFKKQISFPSTSAQPALTQVAGGQLSFFVFVFVFVFVFWFISYQLAQPGLAETASGQLIVCWARHRARHGGAAQIGARQGRAQTGAAKSAINGQTD